MKPKYVFVVGLPRTGSKLMVNILENYQGGNCSITLENFFLGRPLRPGIRQRIKRVGDLSIDSNVHRLVDDMYSNEFYGKYWRGLANGSLGVEKETMLQSILNSDRSHKAIYTVMLQIHTDVTDNTILGDKSGPHLYYVPTLMEWFPDAKVVHTFRDPRAVLASRLLLDRRVRAKRKGGRLWPIWLRLTEPLLSLMTVLYVTIAWLHAARLHYKYNKLYPKNYCLSRFEDLISEPEKSIRKLCEFLEIKFDSTMLSPPKIGSSYRPDGDTGFDQQTLTRWQSHLRPWMNAWLLLWGKKYLREFGYIH